MSDFSRDWLKLREGADLAARDAVLARRFGAALRRRPDEPVRLIDLGAGSGANCRALLPRIGGDQDWILIDRDRDLIAAQSEEFTFWARRQGYPILAGGGRMTMSVGDARWRVTSLPLDLAREGATLDTLDADGVTAAALFDLVSSDWIDGFVAYLARRQLPLLAALTVDGRRVWQPPLPEDDLLAESFRRHQGRDKGFGPALGGAAPARLSEALGGKGFAIAQAPSDWQLSARDSALLAALIAGEAQTAYAVRPEHQTAIAAWEKQRREQLENGRLELTIGHRDLLALPG
jgi:hypothetical protein